MKETNYYKLKKPDETDYYKIQDHDGNMDVVDTALHGLEENKAPVNHSHNWDTIAGKPSGFIPSAHASSHRAGGADALNAADIGAETAGASAAVQANLNNHAANKSNPHGVTAAQVGARPNTWTPTAAEVGARPNTWVPAAAEIGAVARSDKATTAEAQAGVNDDKWVSPAGLKAATQGTIDKNVAVGDIITTRRTSIGSNFVRCNGTMIPENTYPQINELLPRLLDLDAPTELAIDLRTSAQAVNNIVFYMKSSMNVSILYYAVYPFTTMVQTGFSINQDRKLTTAIYDNGIYYLFGGMGVNYTSWWGLYSTDLYNWYPCKLNRGGVHTVGLHLGSNWFGFVDTYSYISLITGDELRGSGMDTYIHFPYASPRHFSNSFTTYLVSTTGGLLRFDPNAKTFNKVTEIRTVGEVIGNKKYLLFQQEPRGDYLIAEAQSLSIVGQVSGLAAFVPSFSSSYSESDHMVTIYWREPTGGISLINVSLSGGDYCVSTTRTTYFSPDSNFIYTHDSYTLETSQTPRLYTVFKRKMPTIPGSAYSFIKVSD